MRPLHIAGRPSISLPSPSGPFSLHFLLLFVFSHPRKPGLPRHPLVPLSCPHLTLLIQLLNPASPSGVPSLCALCPQGYQQSSPTSWLVCDLPLLSLAFLETWVSPDNTASSSQVAAGSFTFPWTMQGSGGGGVSSTWFLYHILSFQRVSGRCVAHCPSLSVTCSSPQSLASLPGDFCCGFSVPFSKVTPAIPPFVSVILPTPLSLLSSYECISLLPQWLRHMVMPLVPLSLITSVPP